jgi:hypothetical protein
LGQPNLELGTSLVQRAIEEIIRHIQPAFFVPLQFIDIAIFEDAGGERKLLCGVVKKQRAFHELATIVPGENAFASKIEMYSLKTFAVYDALVRWIIRTHFLAFSPISTSRSFPARSCTSSTPRSRVMAINGQELSQTWLANTEQSKRYSSPVYHQKKPAAALDGGRSREKMCPLGNS